VARQNHRKPDNPGIVASTHADGAHSEPRETLICNGERFRVYLTADTIRRRVAELGTQISEDYEGRRPVLVGVLNGAFVFMADLMREMSIDCEVDFIKLSSYGDAKITSGIVRDLKTVDADLAGRHVIVVEDIVDTGLSIQYLIGRLREHSPASIRTVALLHKYEATAPGVAIEYVGFRIKDLFVVGYGLDFAQAGRNFRHIFIQDAESEGDG
jgi:hypoxanthine phosphoribosyltransferase